MDGLVTPPVADAIIGVYKNEQELKDAYAKCPDNKSRSMLIYNSIEWGNVDEHAGDEEMIELVNFLQKLGEPGEYESYRDEKFKKLSQKIYVQFSK